MMRISLINQNSKIVFDGDSVTLWDILGLLTKWEFSTAEDGRKARKKTPLASIQTLYHSLEV